MIPVQPGSIRNRLLAASPPSALDRLLPHLRRVPLPLKASLTQAGRPVTTAYFPEAGWASILMALQDGTMAEVGLIGFEGFVGLNAVFCPGRNLVNTMVQAQGVAVAVDIAVLRQVTEQEPALRSLLTRYALTFNSQVAITAACNVRHTLSKRLVRWLLESHDRAEGDEFPMTHEFLSLMLGVRRAGVTVAAAALRDSGLIRYRQGHVHIVDRPRLEQSSCGCQRLVQKEFDSLFQPAHD